MSIKANTYIAIILRSIIYGSTVIFTSKLFSNGVPVLDVLAIRFLLTAIIFVILWLIGMIKFNLPKKQYLFLILASFFEPVIDFTCESIGIKYTSNVVAAIIMAFAPVMAMILETFILREYTTRLQKLFLLFSTAGAVYVAVKSSKDDGASSVVGIIFIIISLVFEELYYVTSRKISEMCAPIEIAFFSSVVGAVVFNSVNVTRHLIVGDIKMYFVPLLDYGNLVGFVYLAIFSSFLAALMSNIAVANIQVSLMVAMGGITTVTTIVLGILFNGETFHLYHAVGAVIIVGSAIMVNVLKSDKGAVNNDSVCKKSQT